MMMVLWRIILVTPYVSKPYDQYPFPEAYCPPYVSYENDNEVCEEREDEDEEDGDRSTM